MDVKERRKEKKKSREAQSHTQAGHKGQKHSREVYWVTIPTITAPFSSDDQEGPSVLRGQANGSLVFIQTCYIKRDRRLNRESPQL